VSVKGRLHKLRSHSYPHNGCMPRKTVIKIRCNAPLEQFIFRKKLVHVDERKIQAMQKAIFILINARMVRSRKERYAQNRMEEWLIWLIREKTYICVHISFLLLLWRLAHWRLGRWRFIMLASQLLEFALDRFSQATVAFRSSGWDFVIIVVTNLEQS